MSKVDHSEARWGLEMYLQGTYPEASEQLVRTAVDNAFRGLVLVLESDTGDEIGDEPMDNDIIIPTLLKAAELLATRAVGPEVDVMVRWLREYAEVLGGAECNCVLPSQSCAACRLAALRAGEELPY